MPSFLTCPVCGQTLSEEERGCRCPSGHNFDRSADGYVNLMTGGQTGGRHGDNPLMVRARRDFLSAGYYDFLRDRVAETVCRLLPPDGLLLDAGCGECYYTGAAAAALSAVGKQATVAGVDISKDAVRYAARRYQSLHLFVSGVYRLPIATGSAAGVLSMFAPFAGEEFRRVLRPDGFFLMVIPGRRHLYGLKQVLYEHPYENEVAPFELSGFRLAEHIPLRKTVLLKSPEDIANLFRMTPYGYRTPEAGRERLLSLTELETELSFEMLLYNV